MLEDNYKNEDKYSIEAFNARMQQQKTRIAQLLFVALLAGTVGAGFGYLRGEVAVLTGESQIASVILAEATSPVQIGAQSISASGAAPGVASFNSAQMQGNSKDITDLKSGNGCPKGQEDKCRNRCSASYVKISGSGVATYDCYGKAGDPGKKAIDALSACVAKSLGGSAPASLYKSASSDFLKQNLCMVDAPKVAEVKNEHLETGEAIDAAAGNTVIIPESCKKEYEEVKKLYANGKEGPQSAVECSVGASVCTQKDTVAATVFSGKQGADINKGAYTCVQKPKAGQGGDATPQKEKSVAEKLACIAKALASGDVDAAKKCTNDTPPAGSDTSGPAGPGGQQQPTNGVTGGQGGGMPKPPAGGGSGSGSGSGQQQPQCPAGYVPSSQAPTTNTSANQGVIYTNTAVTCVPANQANAVAPECIFNASKNNPAKGEKIKLTWQTIGTTNGGRVTLSDGTNTGTIQATGEQEVTITNARTYTLTAYNARNETKACTVAITLGGTGETGTAGAQPPKLACAPSIIEKGRSATITWECSTAAKKSAGEGTTTGGAVKGQKTVTPEQNTEYTVSCFSTTDANIDDESAETFLGKRTCSVRVAEPEFDLVAYPESAARGERVRISWGSLFMKSCKVTGPRGFDYDRPNGVVVTEPFNTNEVNAPDRTIRAAVYTIVCESIFGKRYSADTTVDFEN